MSHIAATLRACAVATVVALPILVTGCVQTTAGSATKAPTGRGVDLSNVPPLSEAALDNLLLSANDINSIAGGQDMEITISAEDMSDHSDVVSEVECLGAMYGAEQPVYSGSGWTAVRDQVVREPTSDKEHWVEQTVVLYPSADKAKDFFGKSRDQWQKCANTSVSLDDEEHTNTYIWDFEDVHKSGESIITQDSLQQASDWTCQHAMGVVTNLIVESFACGYSISDEAEQIVTKIMENTSAG